MNISLRRFATDRLEHFTREAIRLRDRSPLLEYKSLLDMLSLIETKLGTIEHEFALAKLSVEFKFASSEASESWRQVWREFRELRERVGIAAKSMTEGEEETTKRLSELETSYSETKAEDHELRASIRSVIEAVGQATEAERVMNKDWGRFRWLTLRASLWNLSVYVRYYLTKAWFFVFRHAVIFLGCILIFGIGYSMASKTIAEYLSALFPRWWVAPALGVVGYMVKKYYVDPKFRTWQIKVEARRLKLLAVQLHFARTLALTSRTARRQAK